MKKMISMLLAVLFVCNIAACGNGGKGSSGSAANSGSNTANNSSASSGSSTQDSGTAAKSSGGGYPVTITTYDYEGNEIQTTYDKAPEKVLCVYQGTIETMIALGLEDRVVASYGLDNPVKTEWEAGLAKMNYNKDVFAPDKETVLTMKPDMIFSWGSIFKDDKLGDQKEWIANGTNTYISSNTRRGGHPRTLENEYTDLINIGKIFNVEDKAKALVDEMKNEIANVLAKTKGQEAPNVAVIEFLKDEISNYGATQLGGDMVTQLGGKLVEPEASAIGKEDLLRLNPDVIFVVYMARTENVEQEMMDKVMKDPSFADLDAVKNGRVYTIMLGDMYASTVRSIDGIRTFAAGLFPELYK